MTAVSMNAQAKGLQGPEAWQQLALMRQITDKNPAQVTVCIYLKVHASMRQPQQVCQS